MNKDDWKIIKHFVPYEFKCKCGKCDRDAAEIMDFRVVISADNLRQMIGRPIIVRSGFRCPQHNKAIHGAAYSMHMSGMALDLYPVGYSLKDLLSLALGLKHLGGFGVYKTFLHIDCRYGNKVTWRG